MNLLNLPSRDREVGQEIMYLQILKIPPLKQKELGSNPDSDPEYLDYLKEIQVNNKREKNGKNLKQFII